MVALLATASLYSKHVPVIMAKTEKRQRGAFPLTLAGSRRSVEELISRGLRPTPRADAWASEAQGLAPSLAHGLAQPAEREPLGNPLSITEVARLIGCSPWTVRQTLIPRGLPHFRFRANGRLVFYRDQVIRWIEKHQGGNQ